jgi:hypothetical protein
MGPVSGIRSFLVIALLHYAFWSKKVRLAVLTLATFAALC